MFHSSVSQSLEADYKYLEKIFGEESYKLSPAVKQIIAQALKKVREDAKKQARPVKLQMGLKGL